ncbi:MAG: hypothetical protein ACM3U2_02675 [Deltaproteobacteria bacterium]
MSTAQDSKTTGLYSGILHVFVAFDWGEEVSLEKARQLVPAEVHALPRKSRTPPSIAYQSPPLRFDLPPLALTLPVLGPVQAPADLMLFDFGSASLAVQIPFRLRALELTELAGALADPTALVQAARRALEPMYCKLTPAIENALWSDLGEEYFVLQLVPEPAAPAPAQLLAQYPGWLAGLVRLEAGPLSESEIAEALRLRLSYSPDDLIITDWAAAVVVDRDCSEILETMAFANLQLLEFRHIDNRLDARLKTAYGLIHQLERTRLPIFRRHARPIRELGTLKVDVNEMFERASSALMLVGDPYVARLYQQLSIRFHLDGWGQIIRREIAVLEGIYQVVSDQAATYRTEALEVIVVILILTEILIALFRH